MNDNTGSNIAFTEGYPSDREIVGMFFARDENALAVTERQYKSRLMRLAFSFLQSHEDAEECVNDVWLKAWNSIPPQQPDDLFSYLARLCRFTAFDMIDKREALKRNAVILELTAELQESIPDTHAEKHFEEKELSDLLNRFIRLLPEEKRNIFIKRYWYEESIEEIARELHLSGSKVKVTLFRTRKELKAFLVEEGGI